MPFNWPWPCAPMRGSLRLTFVSADDTQRAAAQAEGLLTENPFDHVSPLDTPTDSL